MNVEEKKKLFEAHLELQHKQRQAKLEKKKLEELQKKNPEEHMLYIQKEFKAKAQIVEEQLKKYKAKEVPFEVVSESLGLLKGYYLEVNYALKTYDRQAYKETMDKLYNTMTDLKKKYEPRKKFKFSRRDEDFGVKETEITTDNRITEKKETNIPGIAHQKNQEIVIDDLTTITSYKVVECENVKVDILNKTQILFLKHLKNCTIRVALTKSTVFVDECDGCTFDLNCHQLRIHNTTNTTFKIFVTSKAIIEDCNKVLFTPYQFEYKGRKEDEIQFERTGKQNLWRDIQDFNWLKQNQKSPHYDLIQP